MKKSLLLLLGVIFAFSMQAQSPFVVSPYMMGNDEIMLLGEGMSQNRMYVGGTEQMTQVPMIWNTQTNEIVVIFQEDNSGEDVGYVMTGSFHAVNNNGTAVGGLTSGDYVIHPVMANFSDNGQYTVLYEGANDAGAEAYGISADGSTIVGFHFDESWTTYACIWTNNGTVRTDLPTPTAEQCGFPVEYASARWISANGDVVLGYAQDFNTGAWVAVAWEKTNGEYVVNAFGGQYYQTKEYGDEGLIVPGDKPYFEFQPMALSENGAWVSLLVLDRHDPNDWDNVPVVKAARYNIQNHTFEVVNTPALAGEPEMFGIANDGTSVGRLTGEFDFNTYSQPVDAIIWKTGASSFQTLASMFADDEYFSTIVLSSCSNISGDGRYALGYAQNMAENQTTFIVDLGTQTASINEVSVELAIYPNPASSRINVKSDAAIRSINVMNTMGQVVASFQANGTYEVINVSNLANGMYVVNVITENGVATQRLSIVK